MNTAGLVAALHDPACYPGSPAAVQVLQTHLSIVCLVGDSAYKLKKPVRLPFVDFSSLELRRDACREEVRLNRRLCGDVYRGVAALRRTAAGLRFSAPDAPPQPDDVEAAVVMQRLPADRMLDVLLREGAVDGAAMAALARRIAAFHAGAERGPGVVEAGSPTKLAGFARANFVEIEALSDHGLPRGLLEALAKTADAQFAALLPALQRRAAEGRVCDGHGDLHARNICMTDPPTVYDCIEFAPALRCGDVATENAFLAMDLRYRGAPELAAAYLDAYVAASGDTELPRLLPPLIAYRAMVRAKVAAIAAGEPELDAQARAEARRSAHAHLRLAAAVCVEQRGRWWIVLCGPPASGKSGLAATLPWPAFATDRVRKELAGLAPEQRAGAEHYSAAFSARTYDELLSRATALTRRGEPVVVLDGNFPTPAHRRAALAAARAAGAVPTIAFVDVDAATALARAAARAEDPVAVSDAGAAETALLRARFVPPDDGEGAAVVGLDGARPPADLAATLLTALLTVQTPA